jgi:hypothetical protein
MAEAGQEWLISVLRDVSRELAGNEPALPGPSPDESGE